MDLFDDRGDSRDPLAEVYTEAMMLSKNCSTPGVWGLNLQPGEYCVTRCHIPRWAVYQMDGKPKEVYTLYIASVQPINTGPQEA